MDATNQTNPSDDIIAFLDRPEYKPQTKIKLYRSIPSEITKSEMFDEAKTKFMSWTNSRAAAKRFGDDMFGGDFITLEREFNPDEILVEINKLPLSIRKGAQGELGGSEKEIIVKPIDLIDK